MNGIRRLRKEQRKDNIAILERALARDELAAASYRELVATVDALIRNRNIRTATGVLKACLELSQVADERLISTRQNLKKWKAARY